MKVSPSVRGIAAFSWAITTVAARDAANAASTLGPSEQKPWASGGVRLSSTASSGSVPDVKRAGTSERKTGT